MYHHNSIHQKRFPLNVITTTQVLTKKLTWFHKYQCPSGETDKWIFYICGAKASVWWDWFAWTVKILEDVTKDLPFSQQTPIFQLMLASWNWITIPHGYGSLTKSTLVG